MSEPNFFQKVKKEIKNYKFLLVIIIVIVLPIPFISYFQEIEKFKTTLSSIKEGEILQIPILSQIDTQIHNVYSIEYERKLFPLILKRKISVPEEVERITKFIDSLSKENNVPPEIKILLKLPKQIITNLLSRILSETIVIESNKISIDSSNVIVVFNTNLYYPKYIIFYPVKDIESLYNAINLVVGKFVLPSLKDALVYVLVNTILPNTVFDEQLQENKFKEYIRSKKIPLKVDIKKGDEIIKKGKIISKEDIKFINTYYGEVQSKLLTKTLLLEVILILLALFSILALSVFKNIRNKNILTINTSFLLASLYIQLLLKDSLGDNTIITSLLPSFLILNSIASGRKSTLVIGTYYILLLFLIISQSYLLIINWLILVLIISVMAYRIKKRSDFIIMFAALLLLSFAVYVILHYIEHTSIDGVLSMFTISFVNTFLNLLVVFLVLPAYEYFFRIATPFMLYELSSLDNPLLRELLEKAPGTYYHSLNVSVLSEAAAEAIGANSLLAKVGALYHDIGKTENANYFTENIEGKTKENVNPLEYTEIIKKHPIKGREIAIKNRLPIEIEKIIYEHHGKSVISYFYNEAKKEGYNVDINFFRYSTNSPTSRESTIVFICDKIEAKIRSLVSNRKMTHESIQSEIENTIFSLILSEDLSESDLTLKDINKIIKALKDTIIYIYHSRIEYPK